MFSFYKMYWNFWNTKRKKRKDVDSSRRGDAAASFLGMIIYLAIIFACFYFFYSFLYWASGGKEADNTIKELQAKMDAGEILNNNEMIRYQNAKMTNMGIDNQFYHLVL